MARYQAIAATGQAVLGLLMDACPKPEFEGARFELYQASDFQKPMDDGISLYLYRIAVNGAIRNTPPRVMPNGQRKLPPLPLELYYTLTPWAKTAARQQRLLGWAMRMLEDMPVLPSGVLNNYGPERDVFGAPDTVEVILESLSLQDMSNLWNAAKIAPSLSAYYIARVVAIDALSDSTTDQPLVQAREFDMTRGPV